MSKTASIERAAEPIMKPIRVAVIGAGASGLVTAKYLRQARQYFGVPDIEVRIFEREEGVGGVYKYKVYEEAEVWQPINPPYPRTSFHVDMEG